MNSRRFLQQNQLFSLLAIFFAIIAYYQHTRLAGLANLRHERDEAVVAKEKAEKELDAERHRSADLQEQLRKRKKP